MNRLIVVCFAAIICLLVFHSPGQATTGVTDWLISTDYANIQAAINALPATGGTVYVPAGTHTQTSAITFPTNKPVRLMGAGFGATVLQWTVSNVDYITVRGSHQIIENLRILGNGSLFSTSRGVVVDAVAGAAVLRGFEMRNVDITGVPKWALEATNNIGSNYLSIFCRVEGCHFSNNSAGGLGLVKINQGSNTWSFNNCSFGANWGTMLDLDRCGPLTLTDTGFDAAFEDKPYIKTYNCNAIVLNSCYFENNYTTQNEYFMKITGLANGAYTMASCFFSRGGIGTPTFGKMVQCASGDRVKSLLIENPHVYFSNSSSPTGPELEIGDPQSQFSIVGGIGGNNSVYFTPRVTDGTSKSFLANYNQRVRVPRLSTTERNALQDVSIGDLIYNTTTTSIEVYLGSGWGKVTTTSSP
jgi:hypothetical protein